MNTTSPLRINFGRTARLAQAGAALLVAGAFAFSASVAWYFAVDRELVQARDQAKDVTKMLRRSPARVEESRKDDREFQQEVRIANGVIQQMSIPWDLLFSDIESSTGSEVALLSVQPDAATRVVRISGEAKEFAAMVAYIRRLEKTDHLGKVMLQGHEIKIQDPQKPVAFVLLAVWGAQ